MAATWAALRPPPVSSRQLEDHVSGNRAEPPREGLLVVVTKLPDRTERPEVRFLNDILEVSVRLQVLAHVLLDKLLDLLAVTLQ